jgi:hypothetical protein
MNKIKLSPFWLGMLAAAAVLVVLVVLAVLPKMATHATLSRKLKTKAKELVDAREGTPSQQDIDSWVKHRGDLVRNYNDITKFYTDSDKFLERWFPNLLLGADGDPARDTFMSRYLDEGKQLEEKLAAKPYEVKIGIEEDPAKKPKFGFNWEQIQPNMWGAIQAAGTADEKAVLRELQKRYWARQRLANIIINSGVKVSHILDFRFFKSLHPSLNNAPWQQYPSKNDEVIHWQGVGANTQGQPVSFQETILPGDLGNTMTFGFAVELPYSEVPKAIREILNPGNGAQAQDMLINLIGTHITIRDQNLPLVNYVFIKNDAADEAAKKAEALKKAGGDKARPVLLAVTCQIIDFDSSKVKKFESKAAN